MKLWKDYYFEDLKISKSYVYWCFNIPCKGKILITEHWFKILYELPTEYENYKTSSRGIIFKILLISLKRLTNSFPEVFFSRYKTATLLLGSTMSLIRFFHRHFLYRKGKPFKKLMPHSHDRE